jgi:hypothetical protein
MSKTNTANGSRASENISFRIRTDQLSALRQEAKEKRISLNTLVTQIFDTYVNYASNAAKAGMIPFSRKSIILLLDGYEEEEIRSKAIQIVEDDGKDIALQLRGKYDFETLVGILDSWLKATGFPYRHSNDVETNKHNFIIQHNMSRKFSVLAAEGMKIFFGSLITKGVEYSITDNTIAITIEGGA